MESNQPQARSEFAQFMSLAPEIVAALRSIGQAVSKSDLEDSLVELVKLRTSQINGCAFCVNMHMVEARKKGETEERLGLLCVWHDAPVYTDRERAALAWAESLTLVTEGHVPESIYQEACRYFSEKELASLTGLVVMMNAWNRIGIAYRWTPNIAAKS